MVATDQSIENLKRALSDEVDPSVKNLKQAMDQGDNYPYKMMISPSQFDKFDKCPKQWELRYKDKNYEPEDNEDTMFGDVIHHTIERFLEAKYVNGENEFPFDQWLKEETRKEAVEVKEFWEREADPKRDLPFDSETLSKIYEDGKNVFQEFQTFYPEFFRDDFELIGAEETFSGKAFHNLEFEGRVDLILFNPKSEMFYIVDVKTSRRGWSDRKINDRSKQTQLLAYKYYFSQSLEIPLENVKTIFLIFNRNGSARSDRFEYTEAIPIQSDKERVRWALSNLKDFVNEITHRSGFFLDREYEKRPNKYICRNCPYSTEFNGTGQCDQDGYRWNKTEGERE